MENTINVCCPKCKTEVRFSIKKGNQYDYEITCPKCKNSYKINYFDFCPTCQKAVGFIDQGVLKDAITAGLDVKDMFDSPLKFFGKTIKNYGKAISQQFQGKAWNSNGDGICPYCNSRYIRCCKCSELTKTDKKANFRTVVTCSHCGYGLFPFRITHNFLKSYDGVGHSIAFKSLK